MNLAACRRLLTTAETGVWYRAIEPQHWLTALQTLQSALYASRFNAGPSAISPFEILCLAEDPQVALFEAGALHGSPSRPGDAFPNPRRAWVILNVQVRLQRIAELVRVPEQRLIRTTAQELTGDWRGYQERGPGTSVSEPVGIAPTQALGAALHQVPDLKGFSTLSARVPYCRVLVLFPRKLQPGSSVQLSHPMLGIHTLQAPTVTP